MSGIVTPWLAYMLPFEGEPLAAHFLRSRGSRLSAEDRRWIERQLATPVGVWEILRVDHGRGVDAVDLLTGTRCFVHEAMGSGTLAPRDAILARAVADEVVVFCGVHEAPLDPTNADAVVDADRRVDRRRSMSIDGHGIVETCSVARSDAFRSALHRRCNGPGWRRRHPTC